MADQGLPNNSAPAPVRRSKRLRNKGIPSEVVTRKSSTIDTSSTPRTFSTRKSQTTGGKKQTKEAWLLKGVGEKLKSLVAEDITGSSCEVSSAPGFDLLCTYNWAMLPAPTIYVPGAPSKWRSLDLPLALPLDTGFHFVDQNAYRSPKFPFEPIFKALELMNPDANLSTADLVTNRNSLRHLLGFVQGKVDTFRIDLNTVHDTLFLTRHEKTTHRTIGARNPSGYGHNFETAFTAPEAGLESSGHHRVITYPLGDLNCVVRFEVDAFCDADDLVPNDETSSAQEPTRGSSEVMNSMANLSISKPKRGQGEVKVIQAGRLIPCSALSEVKSKSKRNIPLNQVLAQLWFGRIPHLFVGQHTDGVFTKIEQTDVGAEFLNWETAQQEHLRKLAQLISELRDFTKDAGGQCVLVCDHRVKPLKLEIYVGTARKEVLPKQFIQQYWKDWSATNAAVAKGG
ncbi:hypothetical protein EJ08DRAFT_596344 [Tothia fuscella]|uniref:Geranylgeranyl pyrophosphate synthetase n=1 Tax=Tothia fuscella TaxID=1048955 RepID=A0A9P4TUZ1_9PEZI|nr:hypothetical protein EJ08DRAFT_596344 [Tothia fuscella]